jgi:hypothetical protein
MEAAAGLPGSIERDSSVSRRLVVEAARTVQRRCVNPPPSTEKGRNTCFMPRSVRSQLELEKRRRRVVLKSSISSSSSSGGVLLYHTLAAHICCWSNPILKLLLFHRRGASVAKHRETEQIVFEQADSELTFSLEFPLADSLG